MNPRKIAGIGLLVLSWAFSTPFASAQDTPLTPQPSVENTKSAEQLYSEAKQILDNGGNTDDALEALNGILLMPKNEYTERAQELVGYAHELAGNPVKALAEYRAFLALYPDSPEFKRIQQKAIALEIAAPSTRAIVGRNREKLHREIDETSYSVSVSEYAYMDYFDGKASNTSMITNLRGTSLTKVDDLDLKAQIRFSQSNSLTSSAQNRSNLSDLTYEIRDQFLDYSLKIGRQPGFHGVLGRYDGVSTGFRPLDSWKFNVMAGVPYVGPSKSSRAFVGAAGTYEVDSSTVTGYLNYGIADGIAERQAAGLEYHATTSSGSNVNSTFEYDFLYKSVNAATFQGVFQVGRWSPYLNFEIKKSPILFADRASNLGFGSSQNSPFLTVSDIFNKSGLVPQDVYRYITASTPTSRSGVVGAVYTLSPSWTLGADVQLFNLSAVDLTGLPLQGLSGLPDVFLKQAGSGVVKSFNAMAYGTDIVAKGNSPALIYNSSESSVSKFQSLAIIDGFDYRQARLEGMVKYYVSTQKSASVVGESSALGASLRANLHLNEGKSVEAAVSLTWSRSFEGPGMPSSSHFGANAYVGYRLDF